MKAYFFFLVGLIFFALPASLAEACGSDCRGCRLDQIEKNPNWLAFYQQLKREGVTPLSCYRSYECQVQIAATCGRGRAARPGTSNHQHGVAMDFSTARGDHTKAVRLADRMLKGPVAHLLHRGGGYHMSNSADEASRFRRGGTPRGQGASEYRRTKSGPSGLRSRPGYRGQWIKRRNGQWVRMR